MSIRSRMKTNLDKWDKLHEEIIAKAKQLSLQPNVSAGSICLKTLHEIESDFVMRYNEYVAVFNDSRTMETSNAIIQQVEDQMEKIEVRFRKAPSICF